MANDTVVFTGETDTFSRNQIMALAKAAGMHVRGKPDAETTILVVGTPRPDQTKKSKAQTTAEAMIQAGYSIRMMSEAEFLALIGKAAR